MTIDQDDVIKIIKLMDESDYDELHLAMGELKLIVRKSGAGDVTSAQEPVPTTAVDTTPPEVLDALRAAR